MLYAQWSMSCAKLHVSLVNNPLKGVLHSISVMCPDNSTCFFSISAFGCYSLRSCFNPAIRWLVDASHLSSLVCVVQCFVNVPCVISHRIASLVCMCIHLSADSGEETPLGGFSPSGAFLISYANYKYPRTHYICRAFNFCL